tara:strand:+ start:168886 stop:169344 length:459 start_codon:yes stop_codon:yes gene_type:complete
VTDLGPHNVELPSWTAPAPFEKLLNMEILLAENGAAHLSMPFHYDYCQGAGLMHGGAILSLADTALAMAVKTILPVGTHFGTIAISADYKAPVISGTIDARAHIASCQASIIEGGSRITDHTGKCIAEFRATFKIARSENLGHLVFNPEDRH